MTFLARFAFFLVSCFFIFPAVPSHPLCLLHGCLPWASWRALLSAGSCFLGPLILLSLFTSSVQWSTSCDASLEEYVHGKF